MKLFCFTLAAPLLFISSAAAQAEAPVVPPAPAPEVAPAPPTEPVPIPDQPVVSTPGAASEPAPAAPVPPTPESAAALADSAAAPAVITPPALVLDAIRIAAELPRLTEAAQAVNESTLETLEYDDAHRILTRVPGVYVREEDGFGLRPNIGLRGASSERSSKITLLEDGVLLAPAPYSAPAAYFFPLSTRLVGVDVFKGPATLLHGPHTIGGAIDLKTRDVPEGLLGAIDLGAGLYRSFKTHGYVGYGSDRWGVLVEGARLDSAGSKSIDGGGNTGFDKNELMLKAFVGARRGEGVLHRGEVKLGWADERSRETYLGLSDADFADKPTRRYAASHLDRMQWWRTQLNASYVLEAWDPVEASAAAGSTSTAPWLKLRLTAYRHDFARAWRKLNGFVQGPELAALLKNPDVGGNAVFSQILRGQADSTTDAEQLLIGTNDRRFVSQGVQLAGKLSQRFEVLSQDLLFGARLHHDSIERLHSEDRHAMTSGRLVRDDTPRDITTRNQGGAVTGSFYAIDKLGLWDEVFITPALRVEIVDTTSRDRLQDTRQDDGEILWSPGGGIYWQTLPELALLAGVYRGVTPVAPGQRSEVNAEVSLNYEAGARLDVDFAPGTKTKAELIGFFNDYQNLVGECSFSSGCPDEIVAAQFNGGAVDIVGVEATVQHEQPVVGKLRGRAEAAYTFTHSRFRSRFVSENPQFGAVEIGDALPYVPQHQLSASLGVLFDPAELLVTTSYRGEMRDVAGQGPVAPTERLPAQVVVDIQASFAPTAANQIYLKIDNLFDEQVIVSRRPFGARPGKPFTAFIGYKHWFE